MKTRSAWSVGSVVVAAWFATAALAAPPGGCDVRLSVQLTPDAALPKNPGFLSSLVADPQYELRWIKGTDTAALLELLGPPSDDNCSDGINRLARSSHVLDVEVVDPDSTELSPTT
jgi:hypothetical protein